MKNPFHQHVTPPPLAAHQRATKKPKISPLIVLNLLEGKKKLNKMLPHDATIQLTKINCNQITSVQVKCYYPMQSPSENLRGNGDF